MDYYNIRLIASYEARMVRRDNVFRIFTLLLFVFIAYWQIGMQSDLVRERWEWISMSSFLPFVNAYLFNLLQSLIIIFLAPIFFLRNRISKTMEVFEVRPVSNVEYFTGKIVALFFTFLVLNLISVCVTLFIHVFLSDSPVRFSRYLFYIATLVIPTFFFTLGCVLVCVNSLKNHVLGILLPVSFFASIYFLLPGYCDGLWDCWGRQLPNIFSEVTGHPDLRPYLLHRLAYLILGISFIFFAFSRYRRRPDQKKILSRAFAWGSVTLCFGGLVLGMYARNAWDNNYKRGRYRLTYQEYDIPARARVLSNDITYCPGGTTFSATSKMVIGNPTSEALPVVILYLNPSLKIESMRSGNYPLEFNRENQVIKIDTTLYPGQEFILEIVYSGGIDERVCYLDIPDREYYNPSSKVDIFKYGRRHAFVCPSFTLLHPECLWYPVTIPPVKINADLGQEMNFTRYRLNVEVPSGLTAISQGKPFKSGGRVIFESDHKLSGISLALGNFRKRTMQLSSGAIEVYYFDGNEFFLKNLDTLGKPVRQQLEVLKRYFESYYGKSYLFDKLILAETPLSFTSYSRKWYQGSDYIQPGMVFLPERASKLPVYYRYFQNDKQTVQNYVQYLVSANFRGSQYDISPMFTTYTGCITSEFFLGIDVAFNRMLTSYNGANVSSYVDYNSSFSEAVECLSDKSLLEALSDKEENLSCMNLITQKSLQLQAFLTISIPWRDLKNFLKRFNSRVQFDEVDFSIFQKEFERELQVSNLDKILFTWYTVNQLPVFRVKNIALRELEDDGNTKYIVSLDVWNKGKVDGVLSVITDDKSIGREENILSRNFLIPAGACRSLNVLFDLLPTGLIISTNFSRNMPKAIPCAFSGNAIPRVLSIPEEYVVCDTSVFVHPDEIIVDNRDEGFQIVDSANRRVLLPSLFGKKEEKFLNWTPLIAGINYGDVVRDAYCKDAADGKSFAEWEVRLPRDGYYEVYAYCQNITKYVSRYCYGSWLKGTELHYTIFLGTEAIPVRVNTREVSPGWISLGRFYFHEGQAKVRLSDEGGKQIMNPFGQPDPLMRQLVVADAVKWVFERVK